MKLIIFIFLLFFSGFSLGQAPTEEELKKIDSIVDDAQVLWTEICQEFSKKNGIPFSKLPRKLPSSMENEIRSQGRETLTKAYSGALDWKKKLREAFENQLQYQFKVRRKVTPTAVDSLEKKEEPKFSPESLKTINLASGLWVEFREMFIKKHNLDPNAIPKALPKHFKIMIGNMKPNEFDEAERDWADKYRGQMLEAFLQYAEFHYYSHGSKAPRNIDAETFLGAKDIEVTEVETPKALVPKEKVKKKMDLRAKFSKYIPYIVSAVLILFILFKR